MPTAIQKCIVAFVNDQVVTCDDVYAAFENIMSGVANEAQIAGFLSGFNSKRWTAPLIDACGRAMLSFALKVSCPDSFDIVGTGGDGIDTFNASTASAVLVAAAGGKVVKHGNRSNSSKCGSADLLEALGVHLDISGTQAEAAVAKTGFAFLFAQTVHPTMKRVAGVRKALGVRTVFNVLGPLTNPSCPTSQLTGVFSSALGPLFIEVFRLRKMKRAMVVCSEDGMDEFSPAMPTRCWILEDGKIREEVLAPEDFGLSRHAVKDVAGSFPEINARMFLDILNGKEGPVTDFLVLNTAPALWVAGLTNSITEGAVKAREVLTSGIALKTLNTYIALSQSFRNEEEMASRTTLSPIVSVNSNQSILHQICRKRLEDMRQCEKEVSWEDLVTKHAFAPIVVSPLATIIKRKAVLKTSVSLAAEIKRASPSAGMISPLTKEEVVAQALLYASAGACIISVLTEPHWFKGDLEDLRLVKQALTIQASLSANDSDKGALFRTDPPAVLLKDFVVSKYHIAQARAAGADLVLLIVAMFVNEDSEFSNKEEGLNGPETLRSLLLYARSLGMEPLVEVANDKEAELAVDIGAYFLGINNRDLHTFTVDKNTSSRVSAHAKAYAMRKGRNSLFIASLSGVKSREDVSLVEKAQMDVVLVGETLMRAENSANCIRDLLGIQEASSQ